MKETLKTLVGIPLILASVVLGLMALVMFFADDSIGIRIVAVVLGGMAVAMFVYGRRLIGKHNWATMKTMDSLLHASMRGITDDFQFVTVSPNGKISVEGDNAEEAKLAIKELRILKKSISLQKKTVVEQQKAIRADYTGKVRKQGSKFRGGGRFGRVVRDVQTASRDADRSQLARSLEPLENEKQVLEKAIIEVDGLITRVQAKALQMP